MKTQIIFSLLCLVFLSSCKDEEPTFALHEGEIEFSTDITEYTFDQFHYYREGSLYRGILAKIEDEEDVDLHKIKITEIKLKSEISQPDNLSEDDFTALSKGTFDVEKWIREGATTVNKEYIEIGTLDLGNSSNSEFHYKTNDVNFLFHLVDNDSDITRFKKQFEFNRPNGPDIDFKYYQRIYSFKYKIEN